MLGQHLDEEGLADHDFVHGLRELLREPRHVHAFSRRVEVDRALDLRVDELLGVAVAQADRLLQAGDTGAGEPEPDVREGGLQVVL